MNVTVGRHWAQLPNEILSLIFSYLNPAELAGSVCSVCTRWNAVAIQLLKRLKFGPRGSTQDVLDVVEKATLLESIDIHNRSDYDAVLEALFKNCNFCNNKIEEISLKHSASGYRPHDIVDGMLISCQTRRCCDSLDCFPNSHEVAVLSAPSTKKLIQFGQSLKRLELQNLKIKSRVFFDKIGIKLNSLTQLTVIGCSKFKSSSLQLIAKNCTELTQLTVLDNVKMPDFPGRPSPELKAAWNKAYKDLLGKRGALLQVLEFDAELVWDSTLKALSKATRLQTLSLERAVNLSTNGITAISSLCNLKKLQINYCDRLCEESIARLFGPGNLGGLESLSLTGCYKLLDECLDIISRSCPDLEKVNLTGSPSVTDLGVEFIMTRCTKLRLLNLYDMGSLRNSSLRLIPKMTPNLELLVIHKYCDAEQKKWIEDLMARCPDFQIKPDWPVTLANCC